MTTMRNHLIGATLLATAAALGWVGTAHAGLIINPNGNTGGVQATNEPPVDGGPGFPCGTCIVEPGNHLRLHGGRANPATNPTACGIFDSSKCRPVYVHL